LPEEILTVRGIIYLKDMPIENQFERLARLRARAFSAAEGEKILASMLSIGTFEQLESLHASTFSQADCNRILAAMLRIGTYEQLESLHARTLSPTDSEKILDAMLAISEKLGNAAKAGSQGIASGKRYDVFIAHAAEDGEFVKPLALSLKRKGLEVWYEDFVIVSGDWLQHEIERGLVQSRYVVLILSQNFFNKVWPQKEQEGLATREQLSSKTILPVCHILDQRGVASYSPTLAGRAAAFSSSGAEAVAKQIFDVVKAR
jgi:hypothetical protein